MSEGRAARRWRGRSVLRGLGRAVLMALGCFIVLSVFLVVLYRDVPPPGTPLMLLRGLAGYGIDKEWRSIEAVSPFLIRAVVAAEDAKFCRHNGFDWEAIDAAWDRYRDGNGSLRGASTISMQTAKNVFLWPGRDWLRKAFEAYFTVLIELAWSKQRIIEVYLNVVEWGPGTYGAEAAARRYFAKPASRLTPDEAVRLAAVLPDPLDRSPRAPGRGAAARGAFIARQIPSLPVWEPLPCGGAS